VENDDRTEGFCFAEPPTSDEGKEGGGSKLYVDHSKGNGGDIEREGLKRTQGNLFKLWFDDGSHEEATPEKFLNDRNDENGPEDSKSDRKNAGNKSDFKSGGKGERVIPCCSSGHPGVESNPENNCAEAKKDGVANAGRGRILPAVTRTEPKKKTENKKGANPVQPPSVLGKTLAKVKEPHKKGEGCDERKSGSLQKTFHES
jgi:hypothetical protein